MASVLLIDSDIILSNTIAGLLESAGHTVSHSTNAQTAIVSADHHTPSIVILELLLKGNNGIEFIHEFRSYTEWTNIPVVIISRITEHDAGLSSEILQELNVVDFIYKPELKKDKLLKLVSDYA